MAELIERGARLIPALAGARLARVWGGLLDMTADALPVIEASSEIAGLVIAAGFSGHGFCLGPITGEVVAALVTGRQPSLPIEPFRRARLEGRSAVAAPTLHG